jgi:hypothetical protein
MSKSDPSLEPQVLINCFSGSARKVMCGFFGSQMMPGPLDMIGLNGDFEKAVYKTLKKIR